ncbi:hypothetical protein NLI96_g695 [Meripilus lineatus]|uniref:ER membrane protein complex subunit 10 n=1 Tax=Meripilus lineatus TaxID=2056292 RepID=A0AAD5VC90_9APHY|nr:hypothetical protein NLI96_g695 [Physisporinus lineatus]
MLFLFLLPFLPLTQADASFRIHHRILVPSTPDLPFTERASLLLPHSGPRTSASLVPSETLPTDFSAFSTSLQSLYNDNKLQNALYQLALERPSDKDQSHWHTSSVKACHLIHASKEAITLHLASDGSPYAIDYFLGPLPHDAQCPKQPSSSQTNSKALDLKPITNTSLILRYPTLPPLPQLRTPPPLTQQGNPVEPVPEKTFLQKYWVYILLALAALVLTPGPPDEENNAGPARQQPGQK